MTKQRAAAVAAELRVGLHSPGVCPACISFVSYEVEHGNERRVAGQITSFAPLLWGEGLGEVARVELARRAGEGNAEAAAALEDLDARRHRSTIFRAVVRRLAVELAEGVRRTRIASMN